LEATTRVHDASMQVREVDRLAGAQIRVVLHGVGVPVAGPALVHDLGLELWIEVIGLLTDDLEDILLPRLDMRVVRQEPEQVALRMRRNLVAQDSALD